MSSNSGTYVIDTRLVLVVQSTICFLTSVLSIVDSLVAIWASAAYLCRNQSVLLAGKSSYLLTSQITATSAPHLTAPHQPPRQLSGVVYVLGATAAMLMRLPASSREHEGGRWRREIQCQGLSQALWRPSVRDSCLNSADMCAWQP